LNLTLINLIYCTPVTTQRHKYQPYLQAYAAEYKNTATVDTAQTQ